MSEHAQVLFWGALVIAAVAAYLMWSVGRGPRARPADAPAGTGGMAGPEREALLLQFVVDDSGARRGETVAFEGDQVVLKAPDGFYLVPADRLRQESGVVKLVGDVDWDAARKAGEAWRDRSHKVISYSESELPKDSA